MVLQVDVVNRKISLGLKQLQENPWDEMKENKSRGKLVSGTIKSITDFGAFVDLGNEMEGLVHISQLSEERVENIADVVKIGDEVKCKILEVDGEERKIRLSMKDAAVEGDISDIRDEFSGGNDSGNVSIADALGGQLADLKMKFNGGDEN
jgi:small subunit ribosomal protein S1